MRVEGWEDAYLAVLDLHAAQPFSWNQSNCFYVAMDVVKAVTGSDPWESERGCESEDDFRHRLARLGFSDIGDALAARFPEIHPVQAQRADIGVIEIDGNEIAVVVTGMHAVGKSIAGMVRAPVGRLTRAFKVE